MEQGESGPRPWEVSEDDDDVITHELTGDLTGTLYKYI